METANREIEIKIIHMEMALKLADFPFEKLITVKMSMSYAYYSWIPLVVVVMVMVAVTMLWNRMIVQLK